MAEDITPYSEVECQSCLIKWAWLGDGGACITVYGVCFSCMQIPLNADLSKWDAIVKEREKREARFAARVFPCVKCIFDGATSDCSMCQGRSWVVGRPSGYQDMEAFHKLD